MFEEALPLDPNFAPANAAKAGTDSYMYAWYRFITIQNMKHLFLR
jgi:hypothetical protein